MKPENVDVQSFVYSEPKPNTNGGQTVFINDANRNKIRIHTPKCYIPFGISEFNKKYSLNFSLNSDTDAMKNFKKLLKDIDNNNIKEGVKNSEKWFNKKYNETTINELYNTCIKQTNPNYPPNFKAKLPCKNGNFEGSIYDTNRNEISMCKIQKGCYAEAIIELSGVYFVNKEFGISWKVIQLKLYPTEKICGYSFIDSEDDSSDAESV